MSVFYAERQAAASNLKLTTTIQPVNLPPVVYNSTVVTTNENTPVSFWPAVTDPENNPTYVIVLSLPSGGSLGLQTTGSTVITPIVIGQPYATINSTLIFTPNYLYYGQTTMSYTATDMLPHAGLVSGTGIVTINTVFVNQPAVPVSISQTIYSDTVAYLPLSANDPEGADPTFFSYTAASTCVNGGCVIPCVTAIDTNGSPVGTCITGLTAANSTSQRSWLQYTPYNLGSESVSYNAFDGGVTSTTPGVISLSIICNPSKPGCIAAGTGVTATGTPGLSGSALTGIIAGSVGLALLLGGGVAYLVYYKVAAARFEKEWARDWAQAQISENPMYKSNVREAFNPLYVESG